jgi:hypothetical protein
MVNKKNMNRQIRKIDITSLTYKSYKVAGHPTIL